MYNASLTLVSLSLVLQKTPWFGLETAIPSPRQTTVRAHAPRPSCRLELRCTSCLLDSTMHEDPARPHAESGISAREDVARPGRRKPCGRAPPRAWAVLGDLRPGHREPHGRDPHRPTRARRRALLRPPRAPRHPEPRLPLPSIGGAARKWPSRPRLFVITAAAPRGSRNGEGTSDAFSLPDCERCRRWWLPSG